jgi:hypothetical protein
VSGFLPFFLASSSSCGCSRGNILGLFEFNFGPHNGLLSLRHKKTSFIRKRLLPALSFAGLHDERDRPELSPG